MFCGLLPTVHQLVHLAWQACKAISSTMLKSSTLKRRSNSLRCLLLPAWWRHYPSLQILVQKYEVSFDALHTYFDILHLLDWLHVQLNLYILARFLVQAPSVCLLTQDVLGVPETDLNSRSLERFSYIKKLFCGFWHSSSLDHGHELVQFLNGVV